MHLIKIGVRVGTHTNNVNVSLSHHDNQNNKDKTTSRQHNYRFNYITNTYLSAIYLTFEETNKNLEHTLMIHTFLPTNIS